MSVFVVCQKDIGHEPMRVRILVVDDRAPVRQGLRLLLRNHPAWEICGEAMNGLQAIEQNRLLKPDLVVIDVAMPVMNGSDASLAILKCFPGVLILLYTSYLTDELIAVARSTGIGGRVSKDTMPLVIDALEALLRGEEFSGPAN
jgi:DNA-binding NarL/FixJ family response regulator